MDTHDAKAVYWDVTYIYSDWRHVPQENLQDAIATTGSLYWQRLTQTITWMKNQIISFVCDVIIHPYPNFNLTTVVIRMRINYIHYFWRIYVAQNKFNWSEPRKTDRMVV